MTPWPPLAYPTGKIGAHTHLYLMAAVLTTVGLLLLRDAIGRF